MLAPVGAAPAETVGAAARAGAAAVLLYGGASRREGWRSPSARPPRSWSCRRRRLSSCWPPSAPGWTSASRSGRRSRSESRSWAGRELLVARPRVRRQHQARRRRARHRGRDGRAGHGTRRLCAVRHRQRHERCRGHGRRRGGAARRAAALARRERPAEPPFRLRPAGTRLCVRRRWRDAAPRCLGRRRGGVGAGDARLRDLERRALARDEVHHRAQCLDPPAAALHQRDRERRLGGVALHRLPEPCHRRRRPCPAVKVTVRAPAQPDADVVTGTIRVSAAGSQPLHIPWALQFKHETPNLLEHVSLDSTSFTPSDTAPALLTVQAGAAIRDKGVQIEAVSRLDVLLYTSAGRFVGVLARLRNLLPGSYSFGITGRGPTSGSPARRRLRAAAGRVADAAEGRRTEQGAGPLHDRVDSRTMARRRDAPAREPVRARPPAALQGRRVVRHRPAPRQRAAGVQEGGRGLDPDVARRR